MAGRKRKKYIRGAPHLFRQRGKAKIWSALFDGREVSLGTADTVEAQRRLLELAEERKRAARAPAAPPPPLLSELAARYAEHLVPPRVTRKTAASYANRVTMWVEWCEKRGVTRADQIDFKLMSAYVRARSEKVKARTVNRDLLPVRRMFAFAKREGLMTTNPFRGEDFGELKLKEPQPRPNAITLAPEQVEAVVRTARELLPGGHASLIGLVAGSGVRIDEARHLDEKDVEIVDERRGYLHVTPKEGWQPKNYRCRRVPVSRATCAAALEFIRTRSMVRLDDKATWDAILKVRTHLGLPKFSMHDLRRAWASALHAKGAPLKLVSVLLGHSGIHVTERYIRVFATESTGHEYLSR
ncbi:tyrosine-type recombinase/integrase [Polyangium spumosum]|uniref:Tyrosine-type recombinase/integrase n=1 Tax=Polyangium spumosum TaxID=889282 RepID=A0A6N7PRG7_9BACT|nr:tyrosine-type recombinase/integrase [Polyangium spumosum]MRG94638.1 tyrosine-type recombinase/integrase [Polyangium spumosum]